MGFLRKARSIVETRDGEVSLRVQKDDSGFYPQVYDGNKYVGDGDHCKDLDSALDVSKARDMVRKSRRAELAMILAKLTAALLVVLYLVLEILR